MLAVALEVAQPQGVRKASAVLALLLFIYRQRPGVTANTGWGSRLERINIKCAKRVIVPGLGSVGLKAQAEKQWQPLQTQRDREPGGVHRQRRHLRNTFAARTLRVLGGAEVDAAVAASISSASCRIRCSFELDLT